MLKRNRLRRVVSIILIATIVHVSLAGCGGPDRKRPRVEVREEQTISDGRVQLTSQMANTRLSVAVQDEEGRALEGISVRMVADEQAVILFAWDPRGKHFPTIKVIPVSQRGRERIAFIPVVLFLLNVAGVGLAIYELATNPPRVEIVNVGGQKVCRQLVTDLSDVLALTSFVTVAASGYLRLIVKSGGQLVKVIDIIGAGVTIGDVTSRVTNLLGEDWRISLACWNREITIEGKPAYVEVEVEANVAPITEPGTTFRIELIATGEYYGHVADFKAENLTNESQVAMIYPGMSFRNENADRQDLTVIRSLTLPLSPKEMRTVAVRGVCINLDKPAPNYGDRFIPFAEQREDLRSLCEAIERLNAPDDVAQDAVWVITDNEPPLDRDAVTRLFIAAGLNPDHYEALQRTRRTLKPVKKNGR